MALETVASKAKHIRWLVLWRCLDSWFLIPGPRSNIPDPWHIISDLWILFLSLIPGFLIPDPWLLDNFWHSISDLLIRFHSLIPYFLIPDPWLFNPDLWVLIPDPWLLIPNLDSLLLIPDTWLLIPWLLPIDPWSWCQIPDFCHPDLHCL